MDLQTFWDGIKRDCRVGTKGNNSDEISLDILRRLNLRLFRVWRKWNWDWSLVEIDFTQSAGDSDYTFGATVGKLLVLTVGGSTPPLKRYTKKQYYDWVSDPDDPTGEITGYIPLGRSSGNLKIRFVKTPTSDTSIKGWAKKRVVAKVIGDVAAGTFDYFPEEIHDILYEFVKGDIWEQMGDARGPGAVQRAEAMLQAMIEEDQTDPDDSPQSPVPDYIKHKARKRGGTTVV